MRAQAWLIDFLIRAAIYVGLAIVLNIMGNFGQGIWLIVIFLTEWFYPVLFEVLKDGATPGKKNMKIRVINDNGTPVTWSASLVRNLLRVVDFLPFMYCLGLCSVLLSRDFKRLGDIAASTLVVYADAEIKESKIPQRTALAPKYALSLEEQKSILEFSERSPRLSSERCEELADILQTLTNEKGGAAVELLHRQANWMQGQK